MAAPKKPADSGSGNVRVVVRIRPLSSNEIERGCAESITELESEYGVESLEKGPEVLQVQQGDTNWFEFDAVIGHRSTQKDVYVRSWRVSQCYRGHFQRIQCHLSGLWPDRSWKDIHHGHLWRCQ